MKSKIIGIIIFILFLIFVNGLQAKKYCIKSKEVILKEAAADSSIVYFIHKDICKIDLYVTLDDSLFSVLPNKTYSLMQVEPGWHIISVSAYNLKTFDSFMIYCYPGEIQALNVMSLRKTSVTNAIWDDTLPGECYCHGTIFDRYPPAELERILKKNKLKYARVTDHGIERILKIYDAYVKYRNSRGIDKYPELKLNYRDAAAAFQYPENPPVWEDSYEYELKVAPGDKSLMKLGLSKWSTVTFSRAGIDIKNEKKPENNLTISFDNILGFERVLVFGKTSLPFYFTVNYTENGEEKQLRFLSKQTGYITDDTECRVYKYRISYDGKINLDTDQKIEQLDIHDMMNVGYSEPRIPYDMTFWFERIKKGIE